MNLKNTSAALAAILLLFSVASADPHISGDKSPPPKPPVKPHCPVGC